MGQFIFFGGQSGESFTDASGPSPVGYWLLSESGSPYADGSGNGQSFGTPNGSSKVTGPKGLSAVRLTAASSQTLEVLDSSLVNSFPGKNSFADGAMTWGCRVKCYALANGGIMGKDTGYGFSLSSAGTVAVEASEAGNWGTAVVSSNTPIATGIWYSLIGRWDYNGSSGGNVDFFLNGVKQGTSVWLNTRNEYISPLVLGNALYKGQVDIAVAEVFVFNSALSDTQIASISSRGLSGTLPAANDLVQFAAPAFGNQEFI